jgi:hypothetical protein
VLAVAQLLGFEHVHAGRSTPFAPESACAELHFPMPVLEQVRVNSAGLELLLLRAASPMGPTSLVSSRPAAEVALLPA